MKTLMIAGIIIAGIFAAAMIFTWWETKLRKPINPAKKYARFKTKDGIKTGEVVTLNYRTKTVWAKIDNEFFFFQMQDCELL